MYFWPRECPKFLFEQRAAVVRWRDNANEGFHRGGHGVRYSLSAESKKRPMRLKPASTYSVSPVMPPPSSSTKRVKPAPPTCSCVMLRLSIDNSPALPYKSPNP